MKKSSIMAALTACAVGAAMVFAQPATAQNTLGGSAAPGDLIRQFSAADITSILAEFQIETALTPYDGGASATLAAKTSGGAVFFLSMFQCDNPAAGVGCRQMLIFTGTPNAGFAYEDLNTFNMNSDITRAINMAQQQTVMFSAPVFAQGGVGRENIKLLAALFLNDMQNYVNAQSSAAASVSFPLGRAPDAATKLDNLQTEHSPAPRLSLSAATVDHVVSAAVSNTWKATFLTPDAEAFLERGEKF